MGAQEAENAPDLANRGGKTACGGVGESRGRCCEALQATRLRGVPTPKRLRMRRPRLKAAA